MKSIDDIGEWLRSRPGRVRLVGSGSRQTQLPKIDDASLLDFSDCNQIVRLDPGDQTCTVESGVTCAELDAALREHDLELPCLADQASGTIGGLFASDPFGPAAAGCAGPRNLLLGIDGLLADGTAFRSGAPVVKSVAGFDVHKLLVGSHGRLYVAARLHLRLKPRPRFEQWFANRGLDQDQALTLLHGLRAERQAPTVLQLRRERDGSFVVRGRLAGREVHVRAQQRQHGLQPCEALQEFHVAAEPSGEEVIVGQSLPSALGDVLEALPQNAPFAWLGGGRFEAVLPKGTACDTVLQPPLDPGEQRLAAGLKQALDPDGTLV